LKPEKDIYWYW